MEILASTAYHFFEHKQSSEDTVIIRVSVLESTGDSLNDLLAAETGRFCHFLSGHGVCFLWREGPKYSKW